MSTRATSGDIARRANSSESPTPGLRAFDDSLPMALMRARETVMRRFRPALAAHDLTEQQWRVLRALTSQDDPMSVGDLAERTNLLGPSLSRMLVALEARSLITRTSDRDDARRADIVASPSGKDLVAEIAPISEATYAGIEAEFGDDDLAQLYVLLARLADLDSHADVDAHADIDPLA